MVIFNWKGLPNRHSMMDRLGTIAHAAGRIEPSQGTKALGHLIILLRDLGNREDEAREFILEGEHCDRATIDLLKRSFSSIRVACLPTPHVDITGTSCTAR